MATTGQPTSAPPAAAPKPAVTVVSVGKAFVQDGIYPVVHVHADGAPEPDRCYAWVAPGKPVSERIQPIKERRVGKCLRDEGQITAFVQQLGARKGLDAGTFVSELGKFLTNITVPPSDQLLDWIDNRVLKQLKSMNCPGNDLALTNLAYISKEDEGLFVRADTRPSYVSVSGLVFCVEGNSKIPAGCIAFNGPQRSSGQISLNTMLDVASFEPSETPELAAQVTVELEPAAAKGKINDVDADGLTVHFRQLYSKHYFKVGQKIVLEFCGQHFFGTFLEIELASLKDNAVVKAERGMLFSQSTVNFTKSSRVPFKLISSGGQGAQRSNQIFKAGFDFEKLGIGGLDAEFSDILRRAFASRVFPHEAVEALGIKHCRGLMLSGPPGTGKTLMARQIGKMLNAVEPIVVNGPEILNKFVGQSEENIRKLFEPAEKDYAMRGEDADLHIIVFDEIDAICKQRGTRSGDTGVGDSVVNQLLSKMDGVNSVNNVLVIGMTNRKDMLDEALLRPGRFEIQIEIGLPDEAGRLQIFRIHTSKMRDAKRLAEDVDLESLAADTKNYSGAEIAGVVRSASSFAMGRVIGERLDRQQMDISQLKVCMEDFRNALDEVKPAFGVATDEFEGCRPNGIVDYGAAFAKIYQSGQMFVRQVHESERTPLLTVLLQGGAGVGKTALAATLAVESGFPYVKLISPESMVGYSEVAKCQRIVKIFSDSYKSPLSVIVVDNMERLLEYVDMGPRFSNLVLQTLMVLLKRAPPKGKRLLVVGTTAMPGHLKPLGLTGCFNITLGIEKLRTRDEITRVLSHSGAFDESDLERAVAAVTSPISIKQLLLIIEMARRGGTADPETFAECLEEYAPASSEDLSFDFMQGISDAPAPAPAEE